MRHGRLFVNLQRVFPRVAVVLLLGCALALGGCSGARYVPARQVTHLEVLRADSINFYQLKPDRRLLQAVADIHHILTGKPRAPVASRFQSGHWVVTYAGAEVGSLPELASFGDMNAFLSKWAASLLGDSPAEKLSSTKAELSVKLVDSSKALSELSAANASWRSGNRLAALRKALYPMCILAFQQQTYMETGDALQSRALAVLALSKAMGVTQTSQAECLLSRATGYCQHAIETAEQLPEDNSVRVFAQKTAVRLVAQVRKNPNNADFSYLAVRRMAENADQSRWKVLQDGLFWQAPEAVFAIVQSGLSLHHFETELSTADKMLVLLAHLRSSRPLTLEQLPDKSYFECVRDLVRGEVARKAALAVSAIEAKSSEAQGPLLEKETLKAFYDSSLKSALFLIGMHCLDKLAPAGLAEQYSKTLSGVRGESYGEVARWFAPLVAAKTRSGTLEQLVDAIDPKQPLSCHPLVQIFREVPKYVDYREMPGQAAAKDMFLCFDSRPHHRRHAGDIAYDQLLNLSLAESLYSAAITSGWYKLEFDFMPWFTAWVGNRKKLNEFLLDPELLPVHKLHVLELLAWMKTTDTHFIAEGYQKLLVQYPDNWRLTNGYVRFLRSAKQPSQARKVLAEWLGKEKHNTGIEYIEAVSELADLSSELGSQRNALDVLETVEDSSSFEVLRAKTNILDRAGQTDNAIRTAKSALAIYPDNKDACALACKTLWKHGYYDDAAKVIKTFLSRVTIANLDATQRSFVETFSSKPDEGVRAFESLTAKQAGRKLFYTSLASGCAAEKSYQLAFEIQSRILSKIPDDLVIAYDYLKNWKGKPAAIYWMKSKLPENQRSIELAQVAYELKQYDLLWDLVSDSQNTADSERIWLIRAFSFARGDRSHKQDLVQHFSRADGSDDNESGRYLMGLSGQKKMIVASNNPRAVGKAAYVVGLKAQEDDDLYGATDWYRVAMESTEPSMPEYRWSYYQLLEWRSKEQTLDAIEKEYALKDGTDKLGSKSPS